ncbi:XdhC family protein [Pengzhenrongella sicca]|uniref:XdhC family protein n=1 Tax=Pengzhenrongella sicca TaxID=2819238 RepID=A0A8A4Z9S7_9MICO|nr:XdhC/CoxI family protein [Pengzhenrongella sicca]QTE28225.1 XdhC family protein [Pengzhenrongella sicca]
MFEIADRLIAALDAGRRLAVATAVSIDGSAPRTVGTSMAYDGAAVIGSIAGGCVEGAVIEVCERVLADGRPRTVEYGVSDETAYDVGLTCGGTLRVHVRPLTGADPTADRLRAAVRGEAVGVATRIDPVDAASAARLDAEVAARLDAELSERIDAELAARVRHGGTALRSLECGGAPVEVFFEVTSAPPRLIILGAMEFSAALAPAARALGYRVTVCDPRALFASPARFPGVDLVVAWPTTYLAQTPIDERTAVCVLSHDARFDAEAVAIALASPAGYVGAMGSRRTHDRRVASLRERGVPEESIARLRSPIGLDLGASTPAETAISIVAEILTSRTPSRTATPLRSTTGAIHPS